jgi:hypothetical protein
VSKAWFFGLGILSAILAIVSVMLGIMLLQQQRFIPVSQTNAYIMFDNRTAQACWSGPPIKPTTEEGTSIFEKFGGKPAVVGSPKGPNDLPFCKDL